MLEELKEKAKIKKQELDSNPNASENDKKYLEGIFEILSKKDSFNKIQGIAVLGMFNFLGIEGDMYSYVEKYESLMEEINKKYIYVNPEDIKRR